MAGKTDAQKEEANRLIALEVAMMPWLGDQTAELLEAQNGQGPLAPRDNPYAMPQNRAAGDIRFALRERVLISDRMETIAAMVGPIDPIDARALDAVKRAIAGNNPTARAEMEMYSTGAFADIIAHKQAAPERVSSKYEAVAVLSNLVRELESISNADFQTLRVQAANTKAEMLESTYKQLEACNPQLPALRPHIKDTAQLQGVVFGVLDGKSIDDIRKDVPGMDAPKAKSHVERLGKPQPSRSHLEQYQQRQTENSPIAAR